MPIHIAAQRGNDGYELRIHLIRNLNEFALREMFSRHSLCKQLICMRRPLFLKSLGLVYLMILH